MHNKLGFCFSYFFGSKKGFSLRMLSFTRKRQKTQEFCIIKIYFHEFKSRLQIAANFLRKLMKILLEKMKNNLIMNGRSFLK